MALIENNKLNTKDYNKKVAKQREAFSQIDAAMAILEKLPDFADTVVAYANASSFTYSTSPFGFLFNILSQLGVTEAQLRKIIVEVLTYVLPVAETAVKGILLQNLKTNISCTFDSRIPMYLRKKNVTDIYQSLKDVVDTDRGIDIPLETIDPDGLLDQSPFTEPGMLKYFDCLPDSVYNKVLEPDDDSIKVKGQDSNDAIVGGMLPTVTATESANMRTAKLVRANDFNAFLWYVVHKAKGANPFSVTIEGSTMTVDGDTNTYRIVSSADNLNGVLEVEVDGDNESNIRAGDTFCDKTNPNHISICISSKVDDDNKVTGNTIVPVSSDWMSCNWYVDKSNYYSSNMGYKKEMVRDYEKEKAICNFRYAKQLDYRGREIPNSPELLRFTILPKPYVLVPSANIEKDESGETTIRTRWKPVRLLFDSDGNADSHGKFSFNSDYQNSITKKGTSGDYDIYSVSGDPSTELRVNIKNGEYELTNKENCEKYLFECYPGLTVYEFNYDYVMGMKLFDPKVVCQRLFENAANPKYNASFALTINRLKDKTKNTFFTGKQRVLEIVREIIEEDEDEINDCFFSFSNKQYDQMMSESEKIRFHQLSYTQGYNSDAEVNFQKITDLLAQYPETGTLQEQKDVINSVLEASCAMVAAAPELTAMNDASTVKINFLTNILQQLAATLVDALLSPKILTLLYVNEVLMRDEGEKEPMNAEMLMRLMKSIITAVIREVRDIILQKLLDMVLELLMPVVKELQELMLSEQFAAYIAIIKLLLSWFNKGVEVISRLSSILSALLSKFKASVDGGSEIDLPSVLDDITYADIFPSDEKDAEPYNTSC